ncbi:MAG: peptidase [Bacteroidetes bacterium]|nr:peptidase [Bacteroidota bacterium]
MKKLIIITILLGASLVTFQACKKDSRIKVEKNHRKQTGSSANDLLSNDQYKSLVVEIQYMTGFRPTDEAMTRLTNFLQERLNKSNGISLSFTEIGAQGKSSYSFDDIKKIEENNRSEFTAKKQIAAYFLFLDGEFSGNSGSSKVLGAAYYNTSMVIFQKTIINNSGGLSQPSRDKLETTVINHEFGHILGLVNLGTSMQSFHQDTENGAHCDNEDCLMNWIVETDGVIGSLFGSPIPSLDQNCIKDLQANGGK